MKPFLPALLLLFATPAIAGQRATYTQPNGSRLIVDVADDGEARIGEAGREEYGLLLKDGFYMVAREDGVWRSAKIADVAAAIDRVMPPIFRDVFTAAANARKPPPKFRVEQAGTRTVAGRAGKVYRVYGMNDVEPDKPETFVLSDDPALAPVGRAMEQFMNGAMVPAAVLIGPATADIVAETRAIFALGTPLEAGGRFTLASVETVDVPAETMTLPARAASVDELVTMMRAAMKMPE